MTTSDQEVEQHPLLVAAVEWCNCTQKCARLDESSAHHIMRKAAHEARIRAAANYRKLLREFLEKNG